MGSPMLETEKDLVESTGALIARRASLVEKCVGRTPRSAVVERQVARVAMLPLSRSEQSTHPLRFRAAMVATNGPRSGCLHNA